jgi:hypothetical protein
MRTPAAFTLSLQPFYPQQSRKPTTRTAHGHDRPPPDRARKTTATAHLRWIWLGHTQRGRDAGARSASAEPAAGTRGPVGSREMYRGRATRARAHERGFASLGWLARRQRAAGRGRGRGRAQMLVLFVRLRPPT